MARSAVEETSDSGTTNSGEPQSLSPFVCTLLMLNLAFLSLSINSGVWQATCVFHMSNVSQFKQNLTDVLIWLFKQSSRCKLASYQKKKKKEEEGVNWLK